MKEKRKYPRYVCKIKALFEYYEGNPDKIDMETSVPKKGEGFILDISKGGVFVVTNERLSVKMPIRISFTTKKNMYNNEGHIVRTGLLKNNPSDVAVKYAQFSEKGDSYIAIEFSKPLDIIEEEL